MVHGHTATAVEYRHAMRSKRRRRHTSKSESADHTSIDLGASARQIGLFETANGVPHGIAAIAVAFGAALLLLPARALWRRFTGHDRDPS